MLVGQVVSNCLKYLWWVVLKHLWIPAIQVEISRLEEVRWGVIKLSLDAEKGDNRRLGSVKSWF
jgi:hypothetical protein